MIGRFAGTASQNAVGSTTPLINLVIKLFRSMSAGGSVVVAQRYGADDKTGVGKALHTAVALALLAGCLVRTMGFLGAETLLHAMHSHEDVFGLSPPT